MPVIAPKYGFRIAIDFILLVTLVVVLLVVRKTGEPVERGFFCDDTSIRYPYDPHERVSDKVFLLGSVSLPIAMMFICEFFRCKREDVGKRMDVCGKTVPSYLWSLYSNIGIFLFGCCCSQLLTDVAKYSIGRLRPHFLDICNPDWSKIDCSVPGVYIMPECNPEDDFRLKEARLSFPSGHASFSAFTMIYLVLYLQARMRVRVRLVRPTLQYLCIMIAFYTSLSRVSDYKHHWSDVLFGSLLGTTVAVFVVLSVSGLFDNKRFQVFGGQNSNVNKVSEGDCYPVSEMRTRSPPETV